jgi:hypothetical protein
VPREFLDDPAAIAWGLATTLNIGPDAGDRPSLDLLGDAMLVWAGEDVLERLTGPAVEAVWSAELEASIRDGLRRLAAGSVYDRGEPAAALEELDERGRGSRVARAVVQRLAQEIGRDGLNPFFCLCCLDEVVAKAPAAERRRIACEAAEVGVREARISDEELRGAVRAGRGPAFLRALATEGRQAGLRERLVRSRGWPGRACPRSAHRARCAARGGDAHRSRRRRALACALRLALAARTARGRVQLTRTRRAARRSWDRLRRDREERGAHVYREATRPRIES